MTRQMVATKHIEDAPPAASSTTSFDCSLVFYVERGWGEGEREREKETRIRLRR